MVQATGYLCRDTSWYLVHVQFTTCSTLGGSVCHPIYFRQHDVCLLNCEAAVKQQLLAQIKANRIRQVTEMRWGLQLCLWHDCNAAQEQRPLGEALQGILLYLHHNKMSLSKMYTAASRHHRNQRHTDVIIRCHAVACFFSVASGAPV